MKTGTRNKAVFLDRDGCINVEDNHIKDINKFRLYADSLPSIKKLNNAEFKVVVITNQSGVARGFMTEKLVRETNELLLKWVTEFGAMIDRIEYCPHHPEGNVIEYAIECDCRKPKPGLLLRAAEALDINFEASWVIGDKISDIALGPATGAKAILVRTGFGARDEKTIAGGGAPAPEFVADGIGEAVEWIVNNEKSVD